MSGEVVPPILSAEPARCPTCDADSREWDWIATPCHDPWHRALLDSDAVTMFDPDLDAITDIGPDGPQHTTTPD